MGHMANGAHGYNSGHMGNGKHGQRGIKVNTLDRDGVPLGMGFESFWSPSYLMSKLPSICVNLSMSIYFFCEPPP